VLRGCKASGVLPELLVTSGSRCADLLRRTVYLPLLYEPMIEGYSERNLMTTIGGSKRFTSQSIEADLHSLDEFMKSHLDDYHNNPDVKKELRDRVEDIIRRDPHIPFVKNVPLLFHRSLDFIKKVHVYRDENHDSDASVEDMSQVKNAANAKLSQNSHIMHAKYKFTLHDLRHVYASFLFYKIAIPNLKNPVLFVNTQLGHGHVEGQNSYTATLHYLNFFIQ
jgi:hypothetical protein